MLGIDGTTPEARMIGAGAAGHAANFGPVLSVTVITTGIDVVWFAPSFAVNTIVVAPPGNFAGAAGLRVPVAAAPVASPAVAPRSIAVTVSFPGPRPATLWSLGNVGNGTAEVSDAVTRV